LLGSHFVEPREFIDNSVHVRVTHDSFQPLDIAGLAARGSKGFFERSVLRSGDREFGARGVG
jgi:hypothetical protein